MGVRYVDGGTTYHHSRFQIATFVETDHYNTMADAAQNVQQTLQLRMLPTETHWKTYCLT